MGKKARVVGRLGQDVGKLISKSPKPKNESKTRRGPARGNQQPTKEKPMTTNQHVFLPPEEYLTKQEAANLLGLCSRTIQNWIRAGKLKASKPSLKVLRIKRSDIDAMINNFVSLKP
jgi:excisionase family DNA binding protein